MEPEGSLPVYRSPPPVPILSHINPVYGPPIPLPEYPSSYYPSIYAWVFQVISFPQVSPPKSCIHLSPIRTKCHVHLNLSNVITRIAFGEECRPLNFSLCSFIHSPVTSFLLGQDILLGAIFSNALSLCSSLNVSDQVAHPYKTTGKIS